jgi:hypothetical protein
VNPLGELEEFVEYHAEGHQKLRLRRALSKLIAQQQKAEAVVEAARVYRKAVLGDHGQELTDAILGFEAALTAYDEPPAQLYEWVALEGEARHALERAERERDAIRGEMRLLERERNDEQGNAARAEARAQKAERERDEAEVRIVGLTGAHARAEARAQKAEAEIGRLSFKADPVPWRDRALAAEARAQKAEAVVEAAREIRGYVRAHLAGNDADPELTWALEQADAALTAYDEPPTPKPPTPSDMAGDYIAQWKGEKGPQPVDEGLPPDLARILCDPTIIIDRDHEIRLADGRTLFEHIHEWQNAPSDTAGTFPRHGVQSASEKERDDPNPAISPEEAK